MFKLIRKSHLGKEDYGFVTIYHHFTFGDFYDKNRMGIGPLRVLNVERLAPNHGYEAHHHRDMEMLTYVIKGTLSYEDDLGNKVKLPSGSFQYLSAGSGVKHREWNHEEASLRLISIWIEPSKRNLLPSYSHVLLTKEDRQNHLIKVASNKQEGIFKIQQDVDIYFLALDEEHYKQFELRGHSELYLVQISGEAYINGKHIYAGDAIHATQTLHIQPISPADFIIIEII